MIGYDHPVLEATLPMIAQEFDIVHRMQDTILCVQVKCPSLSDYDEDGVDGEDADIRLCLDRWGDLRTPFKLLAE